MIRAALISALLALGGTERSNAQTPDWRLMDADQIVSGSFLILTVPLDDAAALATIAAAIEARFDVELAAEWPLKSISVHCLVVDASRHADIEALIARMQDDTATRTVQRLQDFTLLGHSYPDPLFPMQSSLDQLNAPSAHVRSTGSGVRVGVVDTAIDSAHPDLASRLLETRDFVSTSSSNAAEAHGTAIAGIIAADAANAFGMVGVAPEAELVGLRACWQAPGEPGRCNSFSLARALNFAILNHLDVVNLSLGGRPDPLLEELILAAIEDGMVIVAASGESDTVTFPASIPGVIAAGSSAEGRIPAPAVDVITTAPGDRFHYVSGSSVAAAHVSGVVALLLSLRADLTPHEVGRALSSAVTLRGSAPMLDACEALRSVADSKTPCAQ